MYPEDRVLVGVINRQRDFDRARNEHWYRVPQGQAAKGIHAEYIAFYFSRAFKTQNGGIHYYARRMGSELVRRRDLLPDEPNHPRADLFYHKLQLGELRPKIPPVLNPTRRPVAFIYTTWDRFVRAQVLADLYSQADEFVDRVFYALEAAGIHPQRTWETTAEPGNNGAGLVIECENGTVIASTAPAAEQVISLQITDAPQAVQASVDLILRAIQACGGPLMVSVPIEG